MVACEADADWCASQNNRNTVNFFSQDKNNMASYNM